MSNHSVVEAKERFPELVEPALRGEPMAKLRPVPSVAAKLAMPEGLTWFRMHRIQPSRPQPIAVTVLARQRRDED